MSPMSAIHVSGVTSLFPVIEIHPGIQKVYLFLVMGEEAEWAEPWSPPPSLTTTLVQNQLQYPLVHPDLTRRLLIRASGEN